MLRAVISEKRAAPWLRGEIAATFALACPLIVANLATLLMTTTDVLMLGRLSPEALAAGTLGFNLFFPLLLFGIGVISAASPIVARMVGADRDDLSGPRRQAQQSCLSAIAMTLPVWGVLWNAGPILAAFGEPPHLAALAGTYLHGLQWSLAPNLLAFALRSVFASLNRPGPTLLAGVLAVGVNALGNWLLVFGHFGFPAWGVFGSGIATFVSQSFMLLVMVVYAVLDPHLARYRLVAGPWRFDKVAFLELWRLGAPIGAAIVFEASIFSALTLLMGPIGATSLEGHAVIFQIISLPFMIPLGIAQAATVRVGHAFGARNASAASRSGWVAFGMVIGFMVLAASTMLAIPRLLISARLHRRRSAGECRDGRAGTAIPAHRRAVPAFRRGSGGRGRDAARPARCESPDGDRPCRLLGRRPVARRCPRLPDAACRPRPLDRPRLRARGRRRRTHHALALARTGGVLQVSMR